VLIERISDWEVYPGRILLDESAVLARGLGVLHRLGGLTRFSAIWEKSTVQIEPRAPAGPQVLAHQEETVVLPTKPSSDRKEEESEQSRGQERLNDCECPSPRIDGRIFRRLLEGGDVQDGQKALSQQANFFIKSLTRWLCGMPHGSVCLGSFGRARLDSDTWENQGERQQDAQQSCHGLCVAVTVVARPAVLSCQT
jgi:hypothetical protein